MTDEEVGKVFGHLKSEVHAELCPNCGACMAVCPTDSLEIEGGRPSLKGKCTACGLCYSSCPQVVSDKDIIDQYFEEGSSSEIGYYNYAYSTKANSSDVETAGQNGGFVTSLLSSLLKEGFIDGAAVMDKDLKWRPKPRVAISEEDLIESAGTKYTPAPILNAVREGIEFYSLEEMAVVGTPCEIKAIRRMATGDNVARKIVDNIKLAVGLFCTKCFTYEGLFEEALADQMDIDLSKVQKFDINKGKLHVYREGKSKREIELGTIDEFTFHPCRICTDFSAELADISVGNAGSPGGYSTVVTRTEVGDQAFERGRKADAYEVESLKDVSPGMESVKKQSSRKKKIAEENIESYREDGKPLPPRIKKED